MKGDGVPFSAEGAFRAGLGCCTPPLAPSNFRSENISTMSCAALDHAAVVFVEQACLALALAKAGAAARSCGCGVGHGACP